MCKINGIYMSIKKKVYLTSKPAKQTLLPWNKDITELIDGLGDDNQLKH